jgi:hypothetical protein
MVLRVCLSCLVVLSFLRAGDELVKPEKIRLETWVREDLFAGWIANDTKTFDRGVQKVERYLNEHPDDRTALAFKYLVVSYDILRARAKADDASYAKHLAAANDLRARIFTGNLRDPGPYIVVGSCLVRTAAVAPGSDRKWMFQEGRDLLAKVPELQGQVFEQLPPHLRGELWAELAFASDRLGDAAERDRILDTMVTKLAGTPYETRARSWQKPGNLTKETDYACISCHEPGRLAPTLARVNASGAK